MSFASAVAKAFEGHPSTSTELAVPEDACQAWALRTQADVSSAKQLTREASTLMVRNAAVALDKKYAQTVHSQLKDKMADTTALTFALQDQIRAVESAVRQLWESYGKMQGGHSSKWGPLCVVSRRLEIRDRRPTEEKSNDQFQMDAETERQTLADARQQLMDAMVATKEQMRPLNEVKQEMQEDVLEKRRSYRIDHLCLLDGGHRGDLSITDVAGAPKLTEVLSIEPTSPRNAEPGTGNVNEQLWRSRTQALLAKAARILQETDDRLKLNAEMLADAERMCKKATARTLKSMNENVATLTAQKKSLESELVDVEKMIYDAGMSLDKTSRRLKQHEAPLQTLRRQFLLRQQRTERENIRDPVHEGLEVKLGATKKTVQMLSTQADSTVSLVDDLKGTKQRLQEAARLKTIALRLDISCTKVTQTNVTALFMTAQSSRAPSSPSRPGAMSPIGDSRRGAAARASSADAAAGHHGLGSPGSPLRGGAPPPVHGSDESKWSFAKRSPSADAARFATP